MKLVACYNNTQYKLYQVIQQATLIVTALM